MQLRIYKLDQRIGSLRNIKFFVDFQAFIDILANTIHYPDFDVTISSDLYNLPKGFYIALRDGHNRIYSSKTNKPCELWPNLIGEPMLGEGDHSTHQVLTKIA